MDVAVLARASRLHRADSSSSVWQGSSGNEGSERWTSTFRRCTLVRSSTRADPSPAWATTSGASSSDCEGWTVRELVNHIVTGNYWAAELAAGMTIEDVGDRLDGDVLGDDPLRAYDDSSMVAAAAFRAPGAMEAPCAVSYGPVPGDRSTAATGSSTC